MTAECGLEHGLEATNGSDAPLRDTSGCCVGGDALGASGLDHVERRPVDSLGKPSARSLR